MLTIAIPSFDFGIGSFLQSHGYDVITGPPEGLQRLHLTDVMVTSTGTMYSQDIFDACPRLRLIISPVIGVDTIDIDKASERNILVANCPAPENVIGMAEATIMLMVATLLNLKRKENSLRAGLFMPVHDSGLLAGRVLGFVGYGRIAQHVEERLMGWGVRTHHYDPMSPSSAGLQHVLETSDVVSVHVTLHEGTRSMIGSREVSMMKPSTILINTSRGGVVDERAVADAIDGGRLRGAALDVFAEEPIAADNPLLRCDPERVILTPHCIGHNAETGPSGRAMLLRAIECVERAVVPDHVINPSIADDWSRRWSRSTQ